MSGPASAPRARTPVPQLPGLPVLGQPQTRGGGWGECQPGGQGQPPPAPSLPRLLVSLPLPPSGPPACWAMAPWRVASMPGER